MMRLHTLEISPRSVRIDGQNIICEESGPRVHSLGEDLQIVHIPVLARTVTITGDTHHPDAGTPIYDQLLQERKEREGQA